MSRTFAFDRSLGVPVINGEITGPYGSKILSLVFDSGAARTEIHTPRLDELGYSLFSHGVEEVRSCGPSGPIQTGYLLRIDKLMTLGEGFTQPVIAAFDFDYYEAQIDGLLGFDIISQLRYEMNGPEESITVF